MTRLLAFLDDLTRCCTPLCSVRDRLSVRSLLAGRVLSGAFGWALLAVLWGFNSGVWAADKKWASVFCGVMAVVFASLAARSVA